MTEIPQEWIDKLFKCMDLFYGERWQRMVDGYNQNLLASVWRSSLIGTTEEGIRSALRQCKQDAFKGHLPPTPMEFYRMAKHCDSKKEAV